MKNEKKIREIVAQLYWRAHSDGQLSERMNKSPDFGGAAISIESVCIQLGCAPNTAYTRRAKAAPKSRSKNSKGSAKPARG